MHLISTLAMHDWLGEETWACFLAPQLRIYKARENLPLGNFGCFLQIVPGADDVCERASRTTWQQHETLNSASVVLFPSRIC